jgi:hypothetical protein
MVKKRLSTEEALVDDIWGVHGVHFQPDTTCETLPQVPPVNPPWLQHLLLALTKLSEKCMLGWMERLEHSLLTEHRFRGGRKYSVG